MPIGSLIAGGKKKKAMRRMMEAQEQQNKIEAARAASQAHRDRITQMREARLKRAQVVSGASNAGIGLGSSGVSGAESSIASQLGQNIGILGQQLGFSTMLGAANQEYAQGQFQLQKAQQTEQLWNQVGSTVMSVGVAAAGALGGPAGMAMGAAGGNTFKAIGSGGSGINMTSGNFTWK